MDMNQEKDPVAQVNALFDKHAQSLDGQFHNLLWQILVNESTDGRTLAFYYTPAAAAHEKGWQLILADTTGGYIATGVFCESRERLAGICADLNAEIFGMAWGRAMEIVAQSMREGVA